MWTTKAKIVSTNAFMNSAYSYENKCHGDIYWIRVFTWKSLTLEFFLETLIKVAIGGIPFSVEIKVKSVNSFTEDHNSFYVSNFPL